MYNLLNKLTKLRVLILNNNILIPIVQIANNKKSSINILY